MKAYELIAKPEHWATGFGFRDELGQACDPEDAYSYCALGAIYIAYGQDKYSQYVQKLEAHLTKKKKNNLISLWNDYSTHEEVYKTLKEIDV